MTSATPSALASRQAGAPLRAIQEWMGHRNYATTEIYADYAPCDGSGAAFAQRAFGTVTKPPGAPSASTGSRL